MSKRIWKTMLITCLTIIMLMSTIPLAYADFMPWYLHSTKYDFYTSARTTSGSFRYRTRSGSYATAEYTIGSSLQYWAFLYKYKKVGQWYVSYSDIRVAGGAKVSGYNIGVMKVTVELTLYPVSGGTTQQDGEIYIQEFSLATIGCEVKKPGDQALRDTLNLVASTLWNAIPGMGAFDPTSLAYLLYGGGDLDKDAGPKGGDSTAHVTGRPKDGSSPKFAEVAFDIAYWQLQAGATGWKLYELGIKVSVDFGYWRGTRTGSVPYIPARRSFSQRLKVYVYW